MAVLQVEHPARFKVWYTLDRPPTPWESVDPLPPLFSPATHAGYTRPMPLARACDTLRCVRLVLGHSAQRPERRGCMV